MKYVYLNLTRRTDRNERFLRTNPFLEGFDRIEAVDGSGLRERDLLDAGWIQEPLKAYTPGALGNALSHRRAWDMCISEGQPVTVAEDDAVFNEGFQETSREILGQLANAWDIVLWGWNFDSILHVQVIEGLRESVMEFDPAPLRHGTTCFQAARYKSILLRLLGRLRPCLLFHLAKGCGEFDGFVFSASERGRRDPRAEAQSNEFHPRYCDEQILSAT